MSQTARQKNTRQGNRPQRPAASRVSAVTTEHRPADDEPTYEDDYEDDYEDGEEADYVDNSNPDEDVPERIAQFEKYRERAIKTGGDTAPKIVTDAPFRLDSEQGFNPPLEVSKPSFAVRMSLNDAIQKGDQARAVSLIFGQQTTRVLLTIDTYERKTGEYGIGDKILSGMLMDYLEHFYGKGAFDQAFLNALT